MHLIIKIDANLENVAWLCGQMEFLIELFSKI